MVKTRFRRPSRPANRWFWMMLAFLIVGLMGAQGIGPDGEASATGHGGPWEPFSFWTSAQYSGFEKVALLANVVIALAGLGYAILLVAYSGMRWGEHAAAVELDRGVVAVEKVVARAFEIRVRGLDGAAHVQALRVALAEVAVVHRPRPVGADDQLADLARRHFAIVFVDDPRLDARPRPAAGAERRGVLA